MTYKDKLLDPRWQKKRLLVMERENFACQICNDTKTTLHVHHKKYSVEPWDSSDSDLMCLCKHCHGFIEFVKDIDWKILGIRKSKQPKDIYVFTAIVRNNIDGVTEIHIIKLDNATGEYKSQMCFSDEFLNGIHNMLLQVKNSTSLTWQDL